MLLRVQKSSGQGELRQSVLGRTKERQKGIRSQSLRQRNHHERRDGAEVLTLRDQNDEDDAPP